MPQASKRRGTHQPSGREGGDCVGPSWVAGVGGAVITGMMLMMYQGDVGGVGERFSGKRVDAWVVMKGCRKNERRRRGPVAFYTASIVTSTLHDAFYESTISDFTSHLQAELQLLDK